MNGRRHLVRRAAAVAAMLALAAGCVSIPTSSPVQRGRAVGASEAPQSYGTLPEGPRPGASRSEVVQGFLEAMLAYPQTDRIARRFLTPAAAQEWRSQGLVRVYNDRDVTAVGGDEVRLRVGVDGAIDARGSWTSPPPGQGVLRTRLQMQRVHGQWRIANPPPGLLVDQDYFLRYYAPYSLYFLDPTRHRLVPDPVYALQDDATATTLVTALLKGPTRRLLGSVTTSVPNGTSVEVGVARAASGTIEVPLSDDVLQVGSSNRLLLAAQLAWTLRDMQQVRRVRVTVNGMPLRVPGVGSVFGTDVLTGFDPAGLATSRQLYALRDGRIVLVSRREVVRAQGPAGAASLPLARSFAVNGSAARAALVTRDGRSLVEVSLRSGRNEIPASGGYTRVFSGGSDLLPPSWDPAGHLWFVDDTVRGAVVRVTQGGSTREVDVPGVTGRRVQALAVSRDGARLAALVREGGTTRLVVALVAREARTGVPTDVRAAEEVQVAVSESQLRDPSALVWSSPVALTVLARGSNGTRQSFVVRIDGSSSDVIGGLVPAAAVQVAAGANDDTPVVVEASNQRLYAEQSDGVWTTLGVPGLRFPVYPG